MKEIKLNLKTINVEHSIVESRFSVKIGKPFFDIHPDAAKHLGTTRKKYRKMMNK